MLLRSALIVLHASFTRLAHVLDPLPPDRQPPSKPIIPYKVFQLLSRPTRQAGPARITGYSETPPPRKGWGHKAHSVSDEGV